MILKSSRLNLSQIHESSIKPLDPFLIKEEKSIDENLLSSIHYVPEKFNKNWKLINFHSILPLINAPIGGLRFISDNSFSTLSSEVGGYYNWNEDRLSFIGSARYSAFYPEIIISGGHLNRSSNFFNLQINNENDLITTSYNEDWTEDFISGGVSIPFNFSNGMFSNFARISYRYTHTKINAEQNWRNQSITDTLMLNQDGVNQITPYTRDFLYDSKVTSSDLSLSVSMFRRRTAQQLRPSLGMQSSIRWRKTTSNPIIQGEDFSYSFRSYFPGIFKNHSLSLGFNGKNSKVLDNFKFSNLYNYPRGYASFNFDKINKFSTEYMFPIAYPDASLGFLAFVKRMKLNLFMDYAKLKNQFPITADSNLSSVGAEILFDFRFLRILEIDAGFRISYVSNPEYTSNRKYTQLEFLLLSISE
jgi:hypothetical protein